MPTKNQTDRIDLYYCSGGSDKEYHAQIEPEGGGFVVKFQYGRRGSTLTAGQKNSNPVDRPAAKKILDKLAAEKMAKGYTPGEAGTPYVGTDKAERESGIRPQLLNFIEEDEVLHLMINPAYCMQEKFDGRRTMIRRKGNKVEGINKLGLVIGLPAPIVEAALNLSATQFILDGEAIGDKLYCFDILELNDLDQRDYLYSSRYETLEDLLNSDEPPEKLSLILVESADRTKDKREMMTRIKNENGEGVVFKLLSSTYVPGRPNSGGDQLKFKFYATATCEVCKINDKRSVNLAVFDTKSKPVIVGNCTIPANHKIPEIGNVIEVRYLYAFPGGSLFQPTYLGVRDDATSEDCKLSQLKYKKGEE